jgi:hypothetical protein
MKAGDCSETPLTTSFRRARSPQKVPCGKLSNPVLLTALAIRLMAEWNEARLPICQPFRLA